MVATMPGMTEMAAMLDRGESLPPKARRSGLGSPDDAASLVVWLASARSGDVTGQAIAIGGDRLGPWSHPTEVGYPYPAGGSSVDQIDYYFPAPGRANTQDFLPTPLDTLKEPFSPHPITKTLG